MNTNIFIISFSHVIRRIVKSNNKINYDDEVIVFNQSSKNNYLLNKTKKVFKNIILHYIYIIYIIPVSFLSFFSNLFFSRKKYI